ncbi:migration and invasion-inhibitory protein [Fundulus heteroclitus]|uniref:migration and invasion-inhibitory protein n=1 Tax=Fundulus heteroclitus TaxID=8078 RepID=UPI00165BE507|nr:migration and invasion-inhibitory protein [Fundulus heteroclitus]
MSTYEMDALRKRNTYLLEQLKQQREKLERVSGNSLSRKRGREDEEEEKEERRQPEVMVTLTEGDRGPARAALAKPSVRFTEMHKGTHRHSGTSKHRVPVEPTTLSDSHRNPQDYDEAADSRSFSIPSSPVIHSKVQEEVHSGVRFQSDDSGSKPASDRHRVQPLLGYDWIAGVLDADDSLVERSDEFFNDLHVFRSLNKDECVHPGPKKSFEEKRLFPPLLAEEDDDDKEGNTDSHQCTFSYRINSRLFPVPLHAQECCPVCRKTKSSHPHTAAEPALIRVSIPRTNLLPPYKYKAHRRSSFDPSDSLGLPSHCLSGWSNAGQNIPPPPSSLDLRSSIRTKNSDGSLSPELRDLSSPRRDQSLERISDVRRLARFNFQHFAPKSKPRGPSFPVG